MFEIDEYRKLKIREREFEECKIWIDSVKCVRE